MLRDLSFQVTAEESGARLDRLVQARHPDVPRALVAEAVDAGRVRLNGRTAAKGARVRAGDTVRVVELAEAKDVRVQPNPRLPLAVVHEDPSVLAFDKPAGEPVHPISYRETDTLANAMIGRWPELAGVGGPPLMPALVHRIDTGTSGIVLAARSPAAYAHLREQFARQSVEKVYLAIVRGTVTEAGRLEGALAHENSGGRHRMVVVDGPGAGVPGGAMRAVTQFSRIAGGRGLTLLRVVIRTGVTHQIRCQLAHAGFAVVGDRLYGGPAEADAGLARHFLHALEIAVAHPSDDRTLRIVCPPPPEFATLLGRTISA